MRMIDKVKVSDLSNQAYLSRYQPPFRMITFAAPTSTLTDFPVLIKSNSTFNIGTSTGYDVHFQDLSGNELPFELDYYDSVTGNGAWWVKISSLPSGNSTSIKMLYGDSSITTNQSSPATVWSDYAAVYHLNELNSSSQLNSATGLRSTAGLQNPSFQTYTRGTGRCFRFNHSGGEDQTKGITTPVSLSSNDYSVTMIANNASIPDSRYYLYAFAPKGLSGLGGHNTVRVSTYPAHSEHTIASGIYPHNLEFTASVTGTDLQLYGMSLEVGVSRIGQMNQDFRTGNNGELEAWSGFSEFVSLINGWDGTYTFDVDELRLCTVPHSQDWMDYEYLQYIDHANTTTYGAEQ